MRAIFFNPTNLRISAIKTILSVFDGYVEIKNGPLGLKYMKAGRAHAVQAISHKRSAKKFKQYIKKIVYAMQYSGFRHMFEKNPQVTAVIWNGRSGVRHIFIQAAKDAGVKTLFLELSPLPNSITVDPSGINFENSVPRCSEFFRTYGEHHEDWKFILRYFAQRKTEYSTFVDEQMFDQPYIFVALQSEGDSQLRDYGGNFRTVHEFVKAVCKASTNKKNSHKILIKEHPNCEGITSSITSKYDNVKLVNKLDTVRLCEGADLVVTVNSSVGLQALCLGTPVAAAGDAFWAIDGLSYRPKTIEEIEALFAMGEYKFDLQLRNAYLNFLIKEYYVSLSWQANAVPSLPESERLKIIKMIT